jgi:site-specific DNA recombinase
MKPPIKRCAIYTRKSSEEGLEQEFNSLDAQYESCLAYVTSQKAEGWIPIKGRYDDGGFSGGNLERPGLRQLMADIEAGKVDTVVVYKIDRLTRSLMDFAKLVEVFDRHGVTFVSITQSFNTTTSMGRLTLNVLLSFAQFEREVTGERIRDKIAASKKKGMWMGGFAPVGYNIADKKLVMDPESAPLVQMLFERYHALGCVSALKRELDREGITSRVWSSSTGLQHGGASFSRGILYKILRNPVYIGQISHKGIIYEGQHEAIIGNELWNNVQAQMVGHAARSRGRASVPMAELLKGKIFDPDGRPYSPTYTSKGNRRYRYYISQNLLQCRDHPKGILARLPAQELEDTVLNGIMSIFTENHLAAVFGLEEHDSRIRYIITNKTKINRPEAG